MRSEKIMILIMATVKIICTFGDWRGLNTSNENKYAYLQCMLSI